MGSNYRSKIHVQQQVPFPDSPSDESLGCPGNPIPKLNQFHPDQWKMTATGD